jgi:hypothetical protein
MSDPVTIESSQRRCAHNAMRHLRLLPKHLVPVLRQRPVSRRSFTEHISPRRPMFFCHLKAVEGSAYCMPHSVMHGAPDVKNWPRIEAVYIKEPIRLFAMGLLIQPMLFDGTLVYPPWWEKRFN